MQGLFFESDTGARYVLRFCVLLLGFWTAWRTGKAVADGWGNYPLVVAYTFLLAGMMRFLHYALFQGPFLSLEYYVIDLVLLVILASAGFRYRRTEQITSNYYWLYEKTSAFSWKDKA